MGRGNILYLCIEGCLEPGPAGNSSPGVSPGESNLVALVRWKDASVPAFWTWQMRARAGHITANATPWHPPHGCSCAGRVPTWNGLGLTAQGDSPSGKSPPGPELT